MTRGPASGRANWILTRGHLALLKWRVWRACLAYAPTQALIDGLRLDFQQDSDDRSALLDEMQVRLSRSEQDRSIVESIIHRLLSSYESLDSDAKGRSDRLLGRLAAAWPKCVGRAWGITLLSHSRKSHRIVGYRLFRGWLDSSSYRAMMDAYLRHRDPECLRAIVYGDGDHDFGNVPDEILVESGDANLQSHVIQRLLLDNPDMAELFADTYPEALLLAIGRSRDKRLLPTVRRIVAAAEGDIDMLELLTRVLANLEAEEDLRALARRLGVETVEQQIDTTESTDE